MSLSTVMSLSLSMHLVVLVGILSILAKNSLMVLTSHQQKNSNFVFTGDAMVTNRTIF